MQYTSKYISPLGGILLLANENALIGLWFVGQKYFGSLLDKNHKEQETEVLKVTKEWLDVYFSGKEPKFSPPIHFMGTSFQNKVWHLLTEIPYGKTLTYKELATIFAQKEGIKTMSSQAIGSAIGKNPISIIVPCHRVVGRTGNLTGYAGGIEKKASLLKLENAYQDKFFIPSKEEQRQSKL